MVRTDPCRNFTIPAKAGVSFLQYNSSDFMSIRSFIMLVSAGLCCATGVTAQKKSSHTPATLEQAAWLLGTWKQQTPRGIVYETWTRRDTHTFDGKSFMLKGQDTVIFEIITLVQQAEGLVYVPVVSNQNEGRAVPFPSGKVTATLMEFNNPSHDFPQKISYRKTGKNGLKATISGTQDGKLRSRTFVMTR
jgi:hypothetical protein